MSSNNISIVATSAVVLPACGARRAAKAFYYPICSTELTPASNAFRTMRVGRDFSSEPVRLGRVCPTCPLRSAPPVLVEEVEDRAEIRLHNV
jgi:hypothetical protein